MTPSPEKTTSDNSLNHSRPTGWEDVSAMANNSSKENKAIDPTKFEKPFDDYDTIDSAIIEYLHCDLSNKKGFYGAVMSSGTKRWYPSIKASQSPAKEKFENARYKEWKQNIIDLDYQTAVNKYGHGNTFYILKKLHNYLKSGHDASTQTNLLNSCFPNYDEYEVAFKNLAYNKRSGGGWMYYSSKDEKLGIEKSINISGRLYINAEPMDTFDIADKFVDVCNEAGMPYEFKINHFPNRSDAMVFYVDNKKLGDYTEILSKILDENPKIKQRVGKPPLLTEKVTNKIGYGDETSGESYNQKQCRKLQEAIEAVTNSYHVQTPNGSIQERVKFLFSQHYEDFVQAIKNKL